MGARCPRARGVGTRVVYYCILHNVAGHANKKDIQDLKLSNNEQVTGSGAGPRKQGRFLIMIMIIYSSGDLLADIETEKNLLDVCKCESICHDLVRSVTHLKVKLNSN